MLDPFSNDSFEQVPGHPPSSVKFSEILARLEDQDPKEREAAVKAFGEMDNGRRRAAANKVAKLLKHDDLNVRMTAVQALGSVSADTHIDEGRTVAEAVRECGREAQEVQQPVENALRKMEEAPKWRQRRRP